MQPDELLRPFEQKVIRAAEAYATACNNFGSDGTFEAFERLMKSIMVLEAAKELAEELAKLNSASDGGRMNEAAIGKSRVKS